MLLSILLPDFSALGLSRVLRPLRIHSIQPLRVPSALPVQSTANPAYYRYSAGVYPRSDPSRFAVCRADYVNETQ